MTPKEDLTPPEVAKRLRVSRDKVLNWIRKGELRAFNVGNGFRPSYRIEQAALEEFKRRRAVEPASPRRGRSKRIEGVTAYF